MISCNSLPLRFTETKFEILDQTLLPHEEKWIVIESTEQMIEAIKMLRVRGAPLIGVAAALQVAQAALQGFTKTELLKKAQALYEARPTAVNLMNCIDRMKTVIESGADKNKILQTAVEIFNEDVKLCDRIASFGAELIKDGDQILTHCNTGGLATVGVGTALGVIQKAHQQGKKIHVWVDETRPLTQGGRLTTWELHKLKIPFTLITDNMAAHLMSEGKINKAIVGSDRIAQNGDFANKIGTYSVAVNCKFHNIPFYVAAPFTTVDFHCASGKDIPIEQRAASEVISTWALKEANVYNPSFDVTPATLTTGWIMDTGVYTQKDIAQGIFKNK